MRGGGRRNIICSRGGSVGQRIGGRDAEEFELALELEAVNGGKGGESIEGAIAKDGHEEEKDMLFAIDGEEGRGGAGVENGAEVSGAAECLERMDVGRASRTNQ